MGSSQSLLVWLAPQPKKRLALLVCFALYLRTTGRSLSRQHALLQLHDDRLALGAHVQAALRYTFVAQLISSSEYLLCLVKPLLAARIGRLLVLKPCDARANCTYGPHERNTVDLYGVHVDDDDGRAAGGLKPVLVFVHGGAWAFGHKWQYGLVGEYLATQGILVAVINYRTFPTGSVVDMVEDVESAVFWLAANCDSFGGDSSSLFLSGHSSGGHVGALALIDSALRLASKAPKMPILKEKEIANYVKGFIGLAAPYDISDHYVFESERVVGPFNGVHEISSMKPAMLGISNFTKRSPTALIAEAKDTAFSLPPFFLLHGKDDGVVPQSSSKKLVSNLKEAGQAAAYCEVSNCTHEGLVFAVMGDNVDCREDVIQLIKRIILAFDGNEFAATAALSEREPPVLASSPARAML